MFTGRRIEWSQIFFGTVASLTVVFLCGIFFFLAVIGLGVFAEVPIIEFFFGTLWNPSAYSAPSWGTLSLLLGTIIVSATALVIVVPLGLSSAIYVSQLASPRTREILKPAIEMIASVPSVVLGLLGLLYLAPLIAGIFGMTNGLNALTAAILVAIAALPTIASICEDALSSVSKRYRDASYALGATQWMTIRRVIVPSARSGLIAAILLGFGRIIGETMIVLMVAGNALALPRSLLDSVRPMTATIAIEVKEVVVGSIHWEGLFAIGLSLFVYTFILNLIADMFIHKRIKA
ncbi:MAG: phosphate ABC transporter permease subunit PstC [Patescibacteria group bacterium]